MSTSPRRVDSEEDVEDVPSLVELLKDQARRRKVPDPSALFNNKSSKDYLERVSNLSLEALHQEPSLIKEESSFVSSELTSLCYREYRTFISIHNLSSSVSTAFTSFTSSLDVLLDVAIPDLEAECHAFALSTKETQHDRRKASLVLEHHDKLQDLLEVPVLLETCVRNGYYHEAMELGEHVRKMGELYGDVPIVRDVEREVDKGLMAMLVQLLSLLREPVKLPALVKAVGFLRRLDVLNEEELRVAFITSREHNFRAQLVGIESEKANPVKFVRRYVDLFRENVYDVISHFTTIFLDGAPSSSPTSSSPSPNTLITFTHQALSQLLALLETQVPLIDDPSSLSSILTQLNYCATSFARVGLDFRSLLTRPFEQAVLNAFAKGLREAEVDLETSLKDALRNGKAPATWMVPPEDLSLVLGSASTPRPAAPSSSSSSSPSSSSTQSPPSHLAHFPSLALLCNAHTNTLNSLRLFAPISLFHQLFSAQLASLSRSSAAILSYSKAASSDFMSANGTALQSYNTSTGGGGSGSSSPLIGKGGRPGHRRNPSVSAGPSEQEKKETKIVLSAYGRAFTEGLVPYLRKGLAEGVFGGELGTLDEVDAKGRAKKGEDGLVEELEELKTWLAGAEEGTRPSAEAVKADEPAVRTSSPPPTLSEEPEEVDDEGGAGEKDLSKVDEGMEELEGMDGAGS